jgi:hypothetical protein
MSKRNSVKGRALSDEFLAKLNSKSGIYSPIVKRVQSDKDLDLEFRGNYINIYYQGHNILKLSDNGSTGIHEAFKPKNWPRYLNTPSDVEMYLQLLPAIKDKVAIKTDSKSRELEFEQLLIRANNLELRNNSEYIVLDRQYVVNQSKDKWDIVALRWPLDKRGRPYQEGYLSIIEVKYALNPEIQDIKDQIERYGRYLDKNLLNICDEMKRILDQKLTLGLLAKTEGQIKRLWKLPIVPEINETEIIVYLIDYNRNSDLKSRAEEAGKVDFRGKVHIALGGLALWQANLAPFGTK